MLDFRSRLCIIPAAALVAAGGAILVAAHSAHSTHSAQPILAAVSALAAFAAVVLPAEWLRAKAPSANPQSALALGLSKFLLTILLLAAAVAGMGQNLSPAAFIFGVVLAALFSVLRAPTHPAPTHPSASAAAPSVSLETSPARGNP